MSVLEWAHGRRIHPRRVSVLSGIVAEMLPPGASVLDVGCGDGLITGSVMKSRSDITITGLDIMARPSTAVPVRIFDGLTIPCGDKSVDAVIFVDIIHHALDQKKLLREAARVARKAVIVKDHLLNGFMAGEILRFMDRVGNLRHNVNLPYCYWTEVEWRSTFHETGLTIKEWRTDIGLYPFPLDMIFGRGLHFAALLAPVS